MDDLDASEAHPLVTESRLHAGRLDDVEVGGLHQHTHPASSAAPCKFLVGPQGLRGACGILDTGDPLREEPIETSVVTLHKLLPRWVHHLRSGRLHQSECGGLPEHTIRLAFPVSPERPALRIRCRTGDACGIEHDAVHGPDVTAGVAEQDGMVGRHPVEEFPGGMSAQTSVLVVEPAHPETGRRGRGLRSEDRKETIPVRHPVRIQVDFAMDGILRKLGSGMQMGVVETGQHSLTVEVDHASTGTAGLQHLGVRADQNESSPVNTEGGGRRARRIDGDHDRIVDD